jgi:RHS repeat-associated protein
MTFVATCAIHEMSLHSLTTDSYEYDAFGNGVATSGSTPNNYLYRGEQFDPDLGLYYLTARYMNPLSGRFLGRDPQDGDVADPATLHKYLYAEADPVNGFDPTGRADTIEFPTLTKIDAINTTVGVTALAIELQCAYNWISTRTGATVYAGPYGNVGQIGPCAWTGSTNTWNSQPIAPPFPISTPISVPYQPNCGEPHIGFRAVSDAELYDIAQTHMFQIPPGGVEGKYFSYTEPQAWSFGTRSYGNGNFGIGKRGVPVFSSSGEH